MDQNYAWANTKHDDDQYIGSDMINKALKE